jgi:peptide/nickel transport system permease protein
VSTGLPAVTIEARDHPRMLTSVRSTGLAGIASATVIAIATFVAIFGPLLTPHSPTLPDLSLAWIAPAGGHLLGFDVQGRDVLSRLIVGAQTSMFGLLVVVMVSMVSTLTGVVLAIVAAWRRGAADAVISSGLDILFAFPHAAADRRAGDHPVRLRHGRSGGHLLSRPRRPAAEA